MQRFIREEFLNIPGDDIDLLAYGWLLHLMACIEVAGAPDSPNLTRHNAERAAHAKARNATSAVPRAEALRDWLRHLPGRQDHHLETVDRVLRGLNGEMGNDYGNPLSELAQWIQQMDPRPEVGLRQKALVSRLRQ